eukprot:TRINITY_DN766_c0_g1_i1.p2 TRINITY_DN766_c0_g1~~TRINITY_DN766_c0_g1_i1.p2  ORF type:complete len:119 (-),score=6.36 TRINITY_DN766_c0_g1_i1:172-528(-)
MNSRDQIETVGVAEVPRKVHWRLAVLVNAASLSPIFQQNSSARSIAEVAGDVQWCFASIVLGIHLRPLTDKNLAYLNRGVRQHGVVQRSAATGVRLVQSCVCLLSQPPYLLYFTVPRR